MKKFLPFLFLVFSFQLLASPVISYCESQEDAEEKISLELTFGESSPFLLSMKMEEESDSTRCYIYQSAETAFIFECEAGFLFILNTEEEAGYIGAGEDIADYEKFSCVSDLSYFDKK